MATLILAPEQKIRQRYARFKEAARVGNVFLACRRFGISRKPFYKGQRRFQEAHGRREALLKRFRRQEPPTP